MRSHVCSRVLTAAFATVMMPATSATAAITPAVPAGAGATGAVKTVTYAGYRVQVPSGWPVYNLSQNPSRCVRFDRHAVYLGHPGDRQRCPPEVLGKTDALLIQPIDDRPRRQLSASTVVVPRGEHAPESLPESTSHHIQVALESAGLLVTVTYGDSRATVERVLASASITDRARAVRVDPPAAASRRKAATTEPIVTGEARWEGKGFDTCAAPSGTDMTAWSDSPYRAVGIYIGGVMRACAQPNLSREWVRSRHEQGWRLLPIYVGRQAPCANFGARIDPARAAEQGRAAAEDAITQLNELGIGEGSPVYFDMEAYDSGNDSCRQAVLTFLDAWTQMLHERGYISGVYSSAASGARDLGRASGIAKPDTIWFAHWDGKATVRECRYLSDSWWDDHQRIKQYRGGHPETHGGVRINIDSNVVDGHVAY